MNSIMQRWIGSCRCELLDRTLVWNQRHLMTVLREYEDFYARPDGAPIYAIRDKPVGQQDPGHPHLGEETQGETVNA